MPWCRPGTVDDHYANAPTRPTGRMLQAKEAHPRAEMRRLAGLLGIETIESRWEHLVAAATFEAMSSRAEALAPETRIPGFWKDTRRFFNNGTKGQWHDLMDPGEEARYESWVTKWASPDLALWAHVGAPRL